MIIIPIFQNISARFVFDIELANELFRLEFSWNAREKSWYMNIQDQNENNILTGIKMVIKYKLLEQYRAYADLPDGDFILWDLEQNPITGGVTFEKLGKRYQLLFFSQEEIEAA